MAWAIQGMPYILEDITIKMTLLRYRVVVPELTLSGYQMGRRKKVTVSANGSCVAGGSMYKLAPESQCKGSLRHVGHP